MVAFDLWSESFIFASVYSIIIIIPCILVAVIGRRMIQQLGQYPSRTPIIQMSVFWQLVTVETITFILLIGFFRFFTN